MQKCSASLIFLFVVSVALLLSGCEKTIEQQVVESLVNSEFPIERKMGELAIQQIKKEPVALQTFAWIPMDGSSSRGYVAIASNENIFVSEIYEQGGLYHYSSFEFFPDTLLKYSLREFDAIAAMIVESCSLPKTDDPLLSTSFYGNGTFNSYSLRYYAEISCNTDHPKAALLSRLSEKFSLIPPRKN